MVPTTRVSHILCLKCGTHGGSQVPRHMKLQGIQCSNGGREIKLATYIRPISKDGMFQCNKPFMIFFVSLTISSYVCVTLNTINGVVDWKCEILHSLWLSLYLYIYRERESHSKTHHEFKVWKQLYFENGTDHGHFQNSKILSQLATLNLWDGEPTFWLHWIPSTLEYLIVHGLLFEHPNCT